MAYRLGVDVGGTFTDLLLLEEGTGAFWRHKTPSTPHDSSEGILNGVDAICAKAGITPADIEYLPARHHRRDQRGAGRQGRARRPDHHRGLSPDHADRAQLRARRPCRLDRLAQARAARRAGGYDRDRRAAWTRRARRCARSTMPTSARALEKLKAQGRRGADRQPDQRLSERRARARASAELAAEIMPDVPVSLSHVVLPEMQEYERTLTTVANAAVRPVVGRYVRNLRDKLRGARHGGQAVAAALRRRADVVARSPRSIRCRC